MKGHIRRRGERSWELKFDLGRDSASGKRKTRYASFRGTKREAQIRLAELIASAEQGSYVEPSKLTVGDFVRVRITQWEAAGDISARTAQRYGQLVENQIVPHLGGRLLQKLGRLDIEAWHTALRKSVAIRTVGHAHRVLGKALRDAESDGFVVKNVCKLRRPPKVNDVDKVIVRDVRGLIERLRGNRMYTMAIVAIFTGMRLGEILALKHGRVDLDRGIIEVREAVEETKANGVRFKAAKTKAGRRDITLPDIAIDTLREHRKALLETRLKLGLGKLGDDDLLFPNLDGNPLRPSAVSSDWGEVAERVGLPDVTFHALRHTHASQLIAQGVDIVTISKRLGHAKPSVTLSTYAHMLTSDDRKAAVAINAALKF
jgi:integrase